MTILETLGEVELQRAEGNRMLAAALAEGVRRLMHAIAGVFTRTPTHAPTV
jgi:hypothetical protein